jgi:hypothetical protein
MSSCDSSQSLQCCLIWRGPIRALPLAFFVGTKAGLEPRGFTPLLSFALQNAKKSNSRTMISRGWNPLRTLFDIAVFFEGTDALFVGLGIRVDNVLRPFTCYTGTAEPREGCPLSTGAADAAGCDCSPAADFLRAASFSTT